MRERVILPPKGWRKAIPKRIRRLVLKRDGYPEDAKGIHLDHRPPLHERPYDEAVDDTVPPANDPAFLFALTPAEHGERTPVDVSRMGKTRRLRQREDEHAEAMERDWGKRLVRKGQIRSRGFDKTRSRHFDGTVTSR